MLSKLRERYKRSMHHKREIEEVKEWLRSYRKLATQVDALKERLVATREQLTSARALVYDDMPHGSGSLSDLSDAMVRLEEQEGEIIEKLLEVDSARMEIVDALNTLPVPVREVMYDRYISWKSWERIFVESNMSKRAVLYRHKDGLMILIAKCPH